MWVCRFCHQIPSGQYLIPVNETALHGSNEFTLASSRVLANRAKAIERSLSALATVGPCLEFYYPQGVAPASDGNVYVADEGNHRI